MGIYGVYLRVQLVFFDSAIKGQKWWLVRGDIIIDLIQTRNADQRQSGSIIAHIFIAKQYNLKFDLLEEYQIF